MSDVSALYITTIVVLTGLALWAGYVLVRAKDAPDESPAEGDGSEADDGPPAAGPSIHEQKTRKHVVIRDETPPPATVDISSPSERAILIAGQAAPVVILPAMRARLDSHTEIRDDGSEPGIAVVGGGADEDADRESLPPMSQIPWSLVSAIGKNDPLQTSTERSAIVDRHRLFIVANAGGQKVGQQLVSAILVDALSGAFEADSTAMFSAEPALPPRADRLRRAVLAADAKVRARSSDKVDASRIGLLAAHFSPDNRSVFVATVGSDRAYRLREQEVTHLNKESLAGPSSVLPTGGCAVEMHVGETMPGDVYVFGSDGAFLALGDELRAVLTFDASIERVAAHFVAAATRAGMTAGTTAIVVRVDENRTSTRPTVVT